MSEVKDNILVISFAEAKPPIFREMNGKKWVMYGEEDDYPQYLLGLFNKSAKHNAIIRSKVNYVIANGFELKVKDEQQSAPATSLSWVKNVNRFGESLDSIAKKAAFDKEIYGGYYLEVVWRNDKTCEIFHADYTKYRSNADNTLFYYRKDGKFYGVKAEPGEIPAFNPNKRKGKQILYCKDYRPGINTYTLPPYIGAINFIESDIEVSKHVLGNAKCGFTPSKLINLNNGEPNPEEKKVISKKFDKAFSGSEGKKWILSFNPMPDKAPTILDLGASDLTKEDFTAIDELIQQNIFVGHQITSPMLMGIKTQGQLGGRNEMREAFELFKNTYINNVQHEIEEVFQMLAKLNNVNEDLELTPVEPIGFEFSENIIAQNLLQSEIRSKIGAPELMQETSNNELADAIDRIRLLPSKIQDILINSLTENDIRGLFGLPEKAETATTPQDNTQPQQMSADIEMQVFSQYGKSKSDYNIVKRKPVKFSTADEAAFDEESFLEQSFGVQDEIYNREKSILDLLKKNKSVSEIAKKLDITEAVVSGVVNQLVGRGIIDGNGNVISNIEPPRATEISVKYSYEWKDVVPVNQRDTPQHPSRPFCHKLIQLDRLYTRQEIEIMSQKLGYSVWDRKGGFWNNNGNISPECRHTWVSNIVVKKV